MTQNFKSKIFITLFLISIFLFQGVIIVSADEASDEVSEEVSSEASTETDVPDAVYSYDFPEKTGSFYVCDYADVLTDEIEDLLLEESRYFNNTYGLQIVVMTISGENYTNLDDYGQQLVEYWDLGSTDNLSFLLLLDIDGENYYACCGNGIASAFTSPVFPDFIVDNLEESFSQGDYEGGIMAVMDSAYDIFSDYTKGLAVLETAPEEEGLFSVVMSGIIRVFLFIVLLILTAFVIIYARYKMIIEKRRKAKEHAKKLEQIKNNQPQQRGGADIIPISSSSKYDFNTFK